MTDDELESTWDALLAHAPRGLFRHFRTGEVVEAVGLCLGVGLDSHHEDDPGGPPALVRYRRAGGKVEFARTLNSFTGYAFDAECRTHVRRFEPVEGDATP